MEVVVGRVGRAHGLAGAVAVEPRTDQPDARFRAGTILATDPPEAGPLTVRSARWQGDRLLVHFEQVTDRDAAERLARTVLALDVAEDERPDDPEEFYDHQLVGLEVVDAAGLRLGTVTQVLHLPMQDVLAIRDDPPRDGLDSEAAGREVLLPFVHELVPRVEPERGRVVVEPPPGLFEEQPGPGAGEPAEQPGPGAGGDPS